MHFMPQYKLDYRLDQHYSYIDIVIVIYFALIFSD